MRADFDLTDPDVVRNPYPLFKELRQQGPVVWSPALKGWMVLGYDEVKHALRTQDFSVDNIGPFLAAKGDDPAIRELGSYIKDWLIFTDRPKHTGLRAVMNRGFAASKMARMEPMVRNYVNGLIDGFADRGEIDLIGDFAFPLPAMVISGMIGVPDEVIPEIKGWSDDLGQFIAGAPGTGKYELARNGARQMADCFQELIEKRRANPQDDLLTELVKARDEGKFDSDEHLVANCILLLFAGHETTTNLIANGTYHLLRHPEQYRLLQEGAVEIPTAVEELLRFDNPAHGLTRVAVAPVELGGQQIQAGDQINVFVTAANRDEAVFDAPDQLNLHRKPNPHLSFGSGIHLCLGAPLARMEGCAVFDILPKRLKNLTLLETEPEWKPLLVLRSMKGLKVRFDPGASIAQAS